MAHPGTEQANNSHHPHHGHHSHHSHPSSDGHNDGHEDLDGLDGLEDGAGKSASHFYHLLLHSCRVYQQWWITPAEFVLHSVVCLLVITAACSLAGTIQQAYRNRSAVMKLAVVEAAVSTEASDSSGSEQRMVASPLDSKCRLRLVESFPQNLTFPSPNPNSNSPGSIPTFDAWMELIDSARDTLLIAAYKSSLRGVHVFGPMAQSYSAPGEEVYEAIVRAGLERGVGIRMVENGPSKDKGDNEDGRLMAKQKVLSHRVLNFERLSHIGVMHSKFLVADSRHFYLGSANLDWRSLNQKMEMGIYGKDCPSLAADLTSIFEGYWLAAGAGNKSTVVNSLQKVTGKKQINSAKPVPIGGPAMAKVHLATSPPFMNPDGRDWDLDAILGIIAGAKSHLYLHVMDYFPMYLYDSGEKKRTRYWPKIDDSLRAAVLRGVEVRLLTSGIHYPHLGMRFLRSLQAISPDGDLISSTSPSPVGRVDIRIFKVPSHGSLPRLVRRDRRTHKKFIVNDDSALIGTSNLSADYFEDRGTGVAIVIREGGEGGLVDQMRETFLREWDSGYAHPLEEYYEQCIAATGVGGRGEENICEEEKDLSLLANGAANKKQVGKQLPSSSL